MTSYQVLSDGRIVYPALVLFEQANYIDWIIMKKARKELLKFCQQCFHWLILSSSGHDLIFIN
jgi:hypothetical protein